MRNRTEVRRPGREELAALIRKEANLSRVAGLLGCSRQTLYRWIYQLGLASTAGVTTRDSSDTKNQKHFVTLNGSHGPRLGTMETAAAFEPRLNTSIKLKDSVWQRVKILAIRQRRSASDVMEEAAELYLRGADGAEPNNGGSR